MLILNDLRAPIGAEDSELPLLAARALRVKAGEVRAVRILRKSLDARKKQDIHFRLHLAVRLEPALEAALLRRGQGRGEDFPSYFSERCIHFSSFLSAVNGELRAYLLRRQYRRLLEDDRAKAASQYAQLSELMQSAADGALRLARMQAPGGKPMNDCDYLRGHQLEAGTQIAPEETHAE